MYEKIGIVTNIWAQRMDQGDSFIDLVQQFGQNGFTQFEVRDGDYLRQSIFGDLLEKLKDVMKNYNTEEWEEICRSIWQLTEKKEFVVEHQLLFQQFGDFAAKIFPFRLSYAISHPWRSQPEDLSADNNFIEQAKRLSYLFCPQSPRLRLVDLTSLISVDFETAKININRYLNLLPQTIFAVENAVQPATDLIKLIESTSAYLTYDEANSYQPDGSVKDDLSVFWGRIQMDDLTSVHFKQKTTNGVLTELEDGWVDLRSIMRKLNQSNYQGDLLIENTPSNDPLTDAINSRRYLLDCLD